jgi:hypothetical protein
MTSRPRFGLCESRQRRFPFAGTAIGFTETIRNLGSAGFGASENTPNLAAFRAGHRSRQCRSPTKPTMLRVISHTWACDITLNTGLESRG